MSINDQPEPLFEEPLGKLDDQPEPKQEEIPDPPELDTAVLRKRHLAALHAVQSGVARTLELDPRSGSPKHLRVGVNAAMCDHAALVRVLIAKGVLTEQEYFEAIVKETEREKAMYEESLGVKLA